MGKARYVIAGAALGAAAVLLSDKENRAKLKEKAKKLKDAALKEGAELKERAKNIGEVVEKEAKQAGKAIVTQANKAKRKASAALKAAQQTK